jgi:hypothetical protein
MAHTTCSILTEAKQGCQPGRRPQQARRLDGLHEQHGADRRHRVGSRLSQEGRPYVRAGKYFFCLQRMRCPVSPCPMVSWLLTLSSLRPLLAGSLGQHRLHRGRTRRRRVALAVPGLREQGARGREARPSACAVAGRAGEAGREAPRLPVHAVNFWASGFAYCLIGGGITQQLQQHLRLSYYRVRFWPCRWLVYPGRGQQISAAGIGAGPSTVQARPSISRPSYYFCGIPVLCVPCADEVACLSGVHLARGSKSEARPRASPAHRVCHSHIAYTDRNAELLAALF